MLGKQCGVAIVHIEVLNDITDSSLHGLSWTDEELCSIVVEICEA